MSRLKISLPAGQFKAILDSRRMDGKESNLQGRLSILDSAGVVINKDAIRLNEIENGYRWVYAFSLKTPTTMILKLATEEIKQKFWLTVLKEPAPAFLPFFEEITPRSMEIDQPESGTLSEGEFVYYSLRLTRGEYKATLDFALSSDQKTNI